RDHRRLPAGGGARVLPTARGLRRGPDPARVAHDLRRAPRDARAAHARLPLLRVAHRRHERAARAAAAARGEPGAHPRGVGRAGVRRLRDLDARAGGPHRALRRRRRGGLGARRAHRAGGLARGGRHGGGVVRGGAEGAAARRRVARVTAVRLGPGDEERLAAFFRRHPDTTLFMHSNSLAAGLVDRGEPLQGTYAAAFDDDGAIAALACHCWNGNLLLEAPVALPEVVRAAVAASGRPVSGVIGPDAQARAARQELGLDGAATTLASTEDLFALALDALRVPAPLASGSLRCRPAR